MGRGEGGFAALRNYQLSLKRAVMLRLALGWPRSFTAAVTCSGPYTV